MIRSTKLRKNIIALRNHQSYPTYKPKITSVILINSQRKVPAAFGIILTIMFSVEKLYEEILFESLYKLGLDESNADSKAFYEFLQKSFNFKQDIHDTLLEKVKARERPKLFLNVKVIEAKDLNPSDPNGLADPYVKVYVASCPDVTYQTTVKIETLNPRFKEHFAVPLTGVPNDETLVVEVWDFDKEEDFKEKFTKIKNAKSAKGFRKLLKEIATSKPSRKNVKEFIGGTKVPIKDIPATGLVDVYSLNKLKKKKPQGTIKVRFYFSSEKEEEIANLEHRNLLKVILTYEVDALDIAPFCWKGKFSPIAQTIIDQHKAHSGLTDIGVAFAQWAAYGEVSRNHPLSFELFDNLLDILMKPIMKKKSEKDEELKIFWDATKNMLPACFMVIKKLQKKKLQGGVSPIKCLKGALTVIKRIESLNPPKGFNIFSRKLYSWIKKTDDSTPLTFEAVMVQSIVSGVEKFFTGMLDQDELLSEDNGIRLLELIEDVQAVTVDMKKCADQSDRTFKELMNFNYAETVYKAYDAKVTQLMKPIIEEICAIKIGRPDEEETNSRVVRKFSVIRQESVIEEDNGETKKSEEINLLSTLFQLYLLLKKLSELGVKICSEETHFNLREYYEWFSSGVDQWFDISMYKAWTRIERAIELDKMCAIDSTVNYSTSALDTIAIFHSIRIFWQQLDWPVSDSAIIFLKRMLNDVVRCCEFYADKTAEKVLNMEAQLGIHGYNYTVTKEWCIAINNIDYVGKGIRSFALELGIHETARSESDSKEIMLAIEKAEQSQMQKISELFDKLSKNMNPILKEFLFVGATDYDFMERTLLYMDECLGMLNLELGEENFSRILGIIWTELSYTFDEIVETNINAHQPPSFYSNLQNALKIMRESFKCELKDDKVEAILERVDRMLEIHGAETVELIHEYYKERYYIQNQMQDAPHGVLTVRCHFEGNIISIDILSASNLVPMDSNGLCDPFVKIFFFPEGKFTNSSQMRTKVHKKTLFPLFDETFSIRLSDEQRNLKDAIILFSVMDEDFFGMSHDFAADAYVMFRDIFDISDGPPKHQQLKLTRPLNEDKMESVKALRGRDDKVASNFLKIIKAKIDDAK